MKQFNPFFKRRILITKKLLTLIGIVYFTTIAFAQNYNPDFFPIGVWSIRGDYRPVDDFLFNVNTAATYHHTTFTNLKNQGFNSVFLSYDPIGPTLDTILDIAEMNNLKVIAPMQHLYEVISNSNNTTVTTNDITQAIINDSINRIKASTAVLGYYLYDEPLPGWIDFNVLQNARNILTNMTSDAPHPILSCWNDEQHMAEIDSYLNLDVLMMDAYPLEDGDAQGDLSDYMPSYFYDGPYPDPPPFSDYLNTVRTNHCESQNRPMWVVLQAFGDLETPDNGGYWRQVYPKEIRLQVYLSIMQGAKGIWYFLYESEYPYLLGMLDISGQPTQRLNEVIDINHEIAAISSTLLKLKVAPDQSVVSTNEGEVKLHYDDSSSLNDKYIIAVNTNVFSSVNTQITIQKSSIGYNVQSIQNMYNNQLITFTETPTEINFTLPIDAGSGVLLKLSDQTLSIDDIKLNQQINIYPNPASNNLYIHHDFITIDSYELYDILGKFHKIGKLDENNSIDISMLKKGTYFLKLITKHGNSTTHIIIKE